jgi:hypothetical protein
MDRGGDWGALLRFAAGASASVLAGIILFRVEVFRPTGPWFHCITAGALTAGVLALVRIGRSGQAAGLAVAFALVHIGYAWTQSWPRALAEAGWSAVVGGGVLLSALIFHRLGEDGYRFGKFALLGPLVAGVFFAAAAVRLLAPGWGDDPLAVLLRHVFVGLVVGDAAGLGVELVELLPALRGARAEP